MRENRIITIFGGSGFVGRIIAEKLLRRGYRVRVAVRYPERVGDLLTAGDVGQVAAVACDIKNDADVAAAVQDSYGVVNCVGILYGRGKQTFTAVQAEGAARMAKAAKVAGVQRMVHLSAIGAVANSKSRYGRSKAEGEAAVMKAFAEAVILRPSVIFGRGDGFFNRFGAMAAGLAPVPLVGGQTLFQPVYVGDVGDACVVALEDSACSGRVYELGGLEAATFESLLDLVGEYTGRRMRYVRLPFWLAEIIGFFAGFLPTPPLTRDQVLLLRRDNVVSEGALGLSDLGITPTSLHAILPSYMDMYADTGQYRRYGDVA